MYYYVLSHIRFFVTPWTVALSAPLSMEFSRRDYLRGFSCPPPADLPDTGIDVSYVSCIGRQILYH